jgi:hypothetical protein
MPDFIRVKDKATGHEYSVREHLFNEDAHTRLDKSAYSASGEVAPPKFKTTVAKAAADKSGQKADTEKEKS